MTSESMDVAYVARLARLELSRAQLERFPSQLDTVLTHFRKLVEVDVRDVEPTAYGTVTTGSLREDRDAASSLHDAALANAPDARGGMFRVPRILES